MSCLGGTTKEPNTWFRYYPDGRDERTDGRICNRVSPREQRTSRVACSGCPAFRGLRWDGTVANGLGTDQMTPTGLTPDEHKRYQAALMANGIDEDPEPLWAWYRRQDRELVTNPDGTHSVFVGPGERTLRRIGDPDALERYAARQRDRRSAHPGLDKRGHRDRAAYMQEYRKRNPTALALREAREG